MAVRSPRSASITAATKASSVISMEWNTLWKGTKRAMRLRFAMSPGCGADTAADSETRGSPAYARATCTKSLRALVQQEDNRKQCTDEDPAAAYVKPTGSAHAERDRDERFS